MSQTPYSDFISLASKGIRHVRTPEGSQYFHLPIGAPITEALYQQIKAEHKAKGHAWPKGMTTKNPNLVHTGSTGNSAAAALDKTHDLEESSAAAAKKNQGKTLPAPQSPAPHTASAAPAPAVPHTHVAPLKPAKVVKSSISGPNKFSVGTVEYSAPVGSRLYEPTANSGIKFVITPDNEVHAFNAQGELHLDSPLVKAALQAKFTPEFQGDQNYNVGAFDPIPGPDDLPNVAEGSTLNDLEGTPQFTKTGPDEWTHNGLGIQLATADVQPFVTSGELSVNSGTDSTDPNVHLDLSSMDQPTFQETLKNFPEGKKLYYKGQKLTKGSDGLWSGKQAKNASEKELWYLKNNLSDDKKASNTPAPEDTSLAPTEEAPAAEAPAADAPSAEAPSEPTNVPAATPEKTDAATPPAPPATPPRTDTAEEPKPKKVSDLQPGDVLSTDNFSKLPGGTQISVENDKGSSIYTYVPKSMFNKHAGWRNEETKHVIDPMVFHAKLTAGKITLHAHASNDEKKTPDAPKTPEDSKPKAPSTPFPEPKVMHKDSETKMVPTSQAAPAEEKTSFKQDEAIAQTSDLKNVPVGKGVTLKYTPTSGSGTSVSPAEYRKVSADGWKMVKKSPESNPPEISTQKLATFINDKSYKLHYNESPSEDAKAPKKFSDLKLGETVTSEHIAQMKTGDSVTTPKGQMIHIKGEGDSWKKSFKNFPGKITDSPLTEAKLSEHAGNGVLIKHLMPKVETPKTEAKVETKFSDLKHGDKVSPEHIDSMQPGDSVVSNMGTIHTKKDGEGFLHSTINDSTQTNAIAGAGDLKISADSGNQKVHKPESLNPDQSAEDTHKLPLGEKLSSVSQMDDLKPGSVLAFDGKSGTTHYTKLPNGNILNPNGQQFHPSTFEKAIKDGKFSVHSYPTETGAAGGEGIQLVEGGQHYSHKDLGEALKALESHPSFHISYGLKSLDAANQLHESHDGTQKELKLGSASEFPNLKSKPAAIAFLKKKLGISTMPDPAASTAASSSDAPKIEISAGDAKHEFTAAEIQSAIDILEGYNGKLWANELGKKSNPLGDMKWNDVIGFHKDKNEGKLAAIKLLKEKLAGAETPGEEPKPEAPKAEEPKVETPKTGSPALGDTLNWDQFHAADVGTTIHWDSKNPNFGVPYDATKTDGDKWKSSGSGNEIPEDYWKNAVEKGYITLKSLPGTQEKSEDKAPESPAAEAALKPGDKLSWEQFQAQPVGTTLQWESPYSSTGSTSYQLVKKDDNSWTTNGQDYLVPQWKTAVGNGYLSFVSRPSQQEAAHPEEPLTWEKFKTLPTGSVVHWESKSASYDITKGTDGKWTTSDGAGGLNDAAWKPGIGAGYATLKSTPQSVPDYAQTPVAVQNKLDPNDHESSIDYNQSGILPGKYTSAKNSDVMYVNADGSGEIVDSNGVSHQIFAYQVKNNHTTGLNQYQGVVDAPEVEKNSVVTPVKATTAPKKKPAAKKNSAKKAPLPDVKLENGTYFLGSPGTASSAIYTVKDGQATITKANGDVSTVPLSKLKTPFFAGKILDANGNSIVPEGHTGSITMWNSPMTVPALVEAKKILEEDGAAFFTYATQKALTSKGFKLPLTEMISKVKKTDPDMVVAPYWQLLSNSTPETPANVTAKQLVLDQLDQFLQHADTSVPESNAAALFDWGTDEEALMPTELVPLIATAVDSYYNSQAQTAAYNAIKKHYGNGKIIGQAALSKYDKHSWVTAFSQGNFKQMYQLEVDANANKDKAHPSGFLHPGYEGNEATNQITWGAAVPGEVSAAKPNGVDGSWSDIGVSGWSLPEVQNYLISAHMQHPEHLDGSEQRQWVLNHKDGKKLAVDKLSVLAKTRAESNAAPLSATPVWTNDIKPAKLYDSLFDSTPFPTSQAWAATPYTVSQAWAKDNWDNADFQNALKETMGEDYYKPEGEVGSYTNYKIEAAVGKYFDQKNAEYQAELLKPVYTHVKSIAGGSHEVHLYKDQFGKQYIFKPMEKDSHLFRVEAEIAGNKLGQFWGFGSAHSEVKALDVPNSGEKTGILQDFIPSVSDFSGSNGKPLDITTLTDKQLGQMAAEHVLDWALDNDDTHSENLLLTQDGNVVGIDKGRAFRVFGNWNGITGDTQAHTNASIIYTKLYNGIRDGSITPEQAQAAYFGALKAAQKIQKSSDAAVSALVAEGVAHRNNWAAPDYMTHFDHTQAPQNAEDLIKAVLARKNQITDQIHGMWEKIYKDAGLGALPEPPAYALGEQHLSGWQEPHTMDKVAETKVWGSSPIHASAGIVDGHSLLWTEKAASGETLHAGSVKVGHLAQQKLLAFLQPKVGSEGLSASLVPQFPDTKEWKSSISAAGKDLTKNAVDKNFNADIQKKFEEVAAAIKADSEHYSPELTPGGNGLVTFPSGHAVPAAGLDQYQLALQHYQHQVDLVEQAKEQGVTTNKTDFTLFSPIAYGPQPETYVHSELGKYTQLSDGSYVHAPSSGQLALVHSLPAEVTGQQDGWSKVGDSVQADPVQYKKLSASIQLGSLEQGGIKTLKGTTSSNGQPGHEYQITLPTGEKIFFRNSSSTNTVKSQHGQIRFELAPNADPASSLARVEQHLNTMGLDLNGASEEDAQTVYWRQMFNRVILSNTTSASKGVKDARAQLVGMLSDLRKSTGDSTLQEKHIIEAIGSTMSPEAEHAFWKNLADNTFGADKVNVWLGAGKHLPQYQHMDLANPEATTGHAYWNRIDVELEDLLKKNTMLAIGNSGKDDSLLNYLTTGGMLSTEERYRVLGFFKTGASSSSDQGTGGATGVFTRIAVPGTSSEKSGAIYGSHVAYWNPGMLQQTGSYSYTGDEFGNTDNQSSNNKFNPVQSLTQNSGTGNETLIQHQMSILDNLEIMVFDNASKRNEAIQRMKALGHDTLRGVPIEDRLIMRSNLAHAMQVVKAAWQ